MEAKFYFSQAEIIAALVAELRETVDIPDGIKPEGYVQDGAAIVTWSTPEPPK